MNKSCDVHEQEGRKKGCTKDLSIYEKRQEEGGSKKDRFNSVVCVCVHWSDKRQVVLWYCGGWDERSMREKMRNVNVVESVFQ